ncbi:MAG: hypothetical protein H5T34_03910, partial [Candidatus Methanomethyliales bacterium]|nr:hypothetical protein [Candidatus Methanomethylicales archaeon]
MRRDLLYIDSNIFVYPIIYDGAAIPEARRSREFLLEVARGRFEAYTSVLTWDEVMPMEIRTSVT